jgi:succinate dehydrogenase flavin-adding protein (antitoxin of CptAB toxin-antitoxin module)
METYTILFWEYDIKEYTIKEKNLTIDDIRNYILEDPDERLWTWIQHGDEEEEEEMNEELKEITQYNSVEEIIQKFNEWSCIGEFEYI